MHKYQDAVDIFEKAVFAFPNHKKQEKAECYYNLGVCLFNTKNYEKASEAEKNALDLLPSSRFPTQRARCYLMLGNISVIMQKDNEALKFYQKSLAKLQTTEKNYPDEEFYCLLACAKILLRSKPSKSKEYLLKAKQACKDYSLNDNHKAKVFYFLGRCFKFQGEYLKARKKFDAAAKLWTDSKIGEFYLPRVMSGVCWYKEKNPKKCQEVLGVLNGLLRQIAGGGDPEKIPDYED